jgi:hypothetical protein
MLVLQLALTLTVAAAPRKTLSQYDQAKVPSEPNPTGSGQRVNVTGLIRWLNDTHTNTFSWMLWDTDGSSYLDFVRVLSLTAGVTISGSPFRLWITLIPPSEARGSPQQCSVVADSPLTKFNETALFNASAGNRGCLDYRAWADVIGRLGRLWPHLEAVNIDDFSSNGDTFTRPYLGVVRDALAGSVRLIPTFYYGGAKDFTLATRPWLGNATDGVLFYFRSDREGQSSCAARSTTCAAAWKGHSMNGTCRLPCLLGSCAEASLPSLPAEVADFAAALPAGHPLHLGLYFTGYSGCDEAPSAAYVREALAVALALPSVAGATVYITQHPKNVSTCGTPGATAAGGGTGPAASRASDKGCIVREVFGAWNATVAARSFDARCPPEMPFRAPVAAATTAISASNRCCGSTASFPACLASASCCLAPATAGHGSVSGDDDCGRGDVPACFCPTSRPFQYGNAVGGRFCCASGAGLPDHCAGGGECCLRPGLVDGCQGKPLCLATNPIEWS